MRYPQVVLEPQKRTEISSQAIVAAVLLASLLVGGWARNPGPSEEIASPQTFSATNPR
jgi:hypothetical protein